MTKSSERNEAGAEAAPLAVLIADDSAEAIEQFSAWIKERWPQTRLLTAQTPEEARQQAADPAVENFILDLDFGTQRESGVVLARSILESRPPEQRQRMRILFRTVHAGDPGYLHQVERLIADESHNLRVWGFLDKGAVPKRVAQNAFEQVCIYGLSFTDIFNERLKNSPSKEFSNLEFTTVIYICLGVTNEGIGWLIGASRQSVERIITELYRKLGIPSRRDVPRGIPALLEGRTRLCFEAVSRGLVNPHLLREEDAALRRRMKTDVPRLGRLHVHRGWLEAS
ncbi:MAG: hypothetical protein AB1515_01430 [Nitrospirota bacterium]